MRKAQTFALGVREFGQGSGVFPGYGAHFELASERDYVLFADLNENREYDGSSEDVEALYIETSPKIFNLCAGEKTQPPGDCSLSELDITYLRPAPTIFFKSGIQNLTYADVQIKIKTPDGGIKTIVIWSTGQVAIE